jgi:hypothetical protein
LAELGDSGELNGARTPLLGHIAGGVYSASGQNQDEWEAISAGVCNVPRRLGGMYGESVESESAKFLARWTDTLTLEQNIISEGMRRWEAARGGWASHPLRQALAEGSKERLSSLRDHAVNSGRSCGAYVEKAGKSRDEGLKNALEQGVDAAFVLALLDGADSPEAMRAKAAVLGSEGGWSGAAAQTGRRRARLLVGVLAARWLGAFEDPKHGQAAKDLALDFAKMALEPALAENPEYANAPRAMRDDAYSSAVALAEALGARSASHGELEAWRARCGLDLAQIAGQAHWLMDQHRVAVEATAVLGRLEAAAPMDASQARELADLAKRYALAYDGVDWEGSEEARRMGEGLAWAMGKLKDTMQTPALVALSQELSKPGHPFSALVGKKAESSAGSSEMGAALDAMEGSLGKPFTGDPWLDGERLAISKSVGDSKAGMLAWMEACELRELLADRHVAGRPRTRSL